MRTQTLRHPGDRTHTKHAVAGQGRSGRRAPPNLRRPHDTSRRPKIGRYVTQEGNIFGYPPMRVLIADDHSVVRQGLKQILLSEPDVVVSLSLIHISEPTRLLS